MFGVFLMDGLAHFILIVLNNYIYVSTYFFETFVLILFQTISLDALTYNQSIILLIICIDCIIYLTRHHFFLSVSRYKIQRLKEIDKLFSYKRFSCALRRFLLFFFFFFFLERHHCGLTSEIK